MKRDQFFGKSRGNIVGHQIMQANQRIGFGHGIQGIRRVFVLVAVYIRAGQGYNQRLFGPGLTEPPNGANAAPGMERDKCITRLPLVFVDQLHRMAGSFK